MTSAERPYDVRLAPAAARAYEKLTDSDRERIRRALERVAGAPGRTDRGGKSLKTIEGARDHFHRLRVGTYRIMFDMIADDRVVLVLGIVDRRDLERWLRNR